MPRATVLSVGSDRTLLNLRDQVLRFAGYDVREHTPKDFSDPPEEEFDIVILCHSIPQDEKQHIIRSIRQRNPDVPILFVRADGATAELVDATVHGLDGPQALLDCVRMLLKKKAS